ncbi:hypothetical protein N0V82_006427 [Gnomoniopsis sp. IMI 355080]|nr:hypothetical protein N0V82_006427 [Gnomoniopsis sp. IMI 355080]
MRSSSILAPVVALASVASAGVIPRADVDCSFATGYGCWTVKDLTVTIPPSASHHTFSFGIVHQSQTSNTTCTGTSEEGITCADSAYKIESDLQGTTLTIYEKLYQTGAIAVLGGNTTLSTTCSTNAEATSTTCTQETFSVQSKSVGTIFPNGTTEGFTF